MDQFSLPSDKPSVSMEAQVRSTISTLQTELGATPGGIFWAFMLILIEIDRIDVAKQTELFNKFIDGRAKSPDLLKVLESYAGKR
jgi:hypothetical protein